MIQDEYLETQKADEVSLKNSSGQILDCFLFR